MKKIARKTKILSAIALAGILTSVTSAAFTSADEYLHSEECARYVVGSDEESYGFILGEFKNQKDTTPLHWAAKLGSPEITKLLLDNGANINAIDKKGKTPLTWAIESEKEAKVAAVKAVIKVVKAVVMPKAVAPKELVLKELAAH